MRPVSFVLAATLMTACGGSQVQQGEVALTDFSSSCLSLPSCESATVPVVAKSKWRHFSTKLTALAPPHHRGRDQLFVEGEPQWIIAKFAYGLIDKDLKDEDVAIFVLRDCDGAWQQLGDATTTLDKSHATVLGVEDSGGRVYFEIPKSKRLGVGRHRIRLVVKGDLSATELFIQVVPSNANVFVTDVDGTLTTSEFKEFEELLEGEVTKAHPFAPEVIGALAERGHLPIYVTARPEWLTERTREFIRDRGFPPGIIHTTTSMTGALGSAAAQFKNAELAALAARGLTPTWAFGNKPSDGDAYDQAGIFPLDHRVFYQLDDVHGGRRIDNYGELLDEVSASPSCP